jgi:hypothetical protein
MFSVTIVGDAAQISFVVDFAPKIRLVNLFVCFVVPCRVARVA